MFLIFDTETTGLPKNYNAPLTDFDNWPRLVQLAWQLHDDKGRLIENYSLLVKPDGFVIPIDAKMVHGISTEHATKYGLPLHEVLDQFLASAQKARYFVGHNIDFDLCVVGSEFLRDRGSNPLLAWPRVDTCTEKTAEYCKLPGGKGGRFKLPRLNEIHEILFGSKFAEAHNASADVQATARVFLELVRIGVLGRAEMPESEQFFTDFREANPSPIQPADIVITSNVDEEDLIQSKQEEQREAGNYVPQHFTHLHVHSHYSILDGMSNVPDLVDKCLKNDMHAMALTDHGNMFGIKEFADYANKVNANGASFKPIFGIETYCAPVSINKRDGRQDRGWHLILLAKNKAG